MIEIMETDRTPLGPRQAREVLGEGPRREAERGQNYFISDYLHYLYYPHYLYYLFYLFYLYYLYYLFYLYYLYYLYISDPRREAERGQPCNNDDDDDNNDNDK